MLDDELMEEMKKDLPANIPSLFISAVAQKNIIELKDLLWQAINGLVINVLVRQAQHLETD